jgi:hypothetical protein
LFFQTLPFAESHYYSHMTFCLITLSDNDFSAKWTFSVKWLFQLKNHLWKKLFGQITFRSNDHLLTKTFGRMTFRSNVILVKCINFIFSFSVKWSYFIFGKKIFRSNDLFRFYDLWMIRSNDISVKWCQKISGKWTRTIFFPFHLLPNRN